MKQRNQNCGNKKFINKHYFPFDILLFNLHSFFVDKMQIFTNNKKKDSEIKYKQKFDINIEVDLENRSRYSKIFDEGVN